MWLCGFEKMKTRILQFITLYWVLRIILNSRKVKKPKTNKKLSKITIDPEKNNGENNEFEDTREASMKVLRINENYRSIDSATHAIID